MLRMLKISSRSVTLNEKLAFDTNKITCTKKPGGEMREQAEDEDDATET